MRADIGFLLDLACQSRESEWSGDPGIATAVASLVSQQQVVERYERGEDFSDFLVACVCNWVSSELCSTMPDPGRDIPQRLRIPSADESEALTSLARTLLFDSAQDAHTRSLAGMCLSYFEYGPDRITVMKEFQSLRASFHADCADVVLTPAPSTLDEVSVWLSRVFQEQRGCRQRILLAFANARRVPIDGFSAQQVSIAQVAWEFGYRELWTTDTIANTVTRAVDFGLAAANRDQARKSLRPIIDLEWQGRSPAHHDADAEAWATLGSFARSATSRLVLSRTWGETFSFADSGILFRFADSVRAPRQGHSASLAVAQLRDIALTRTNEGYGQTLVMRSKVKEFGTRFVHALWKSWWIVALTAMMVVPLMFFGFGWLASWIGAAVLVEIIARARVEATFVGRVRFGQSLLLGVAFGGAFQVPTVVAHLLSAQPWATPSLVAWLGGVAASILVVALAIHSPRFSINTRPSNWIPGLDWLPPSDADAIDEALLSLTRTSRVGA